MRIEGQGHFFTIYFPGFVCFVFCLDKISGERLQDHWSSGLYLQIKLVDPTTKDCKTLVGTGGAGTDQGDDWSQFELSEPGGLCADETSGLVYVADTNNHRIVIVDTVAKKCSVVSYASPLVCRNGTEHLSYITRKPVLVSDQVRHKQCCSATEDGQRLEISDSGSRVVVLSL